MELLRAVHSIIFLVTFFGTALSDREGGVRECKYTTTIYQEVYEAGNNCAELGATPTTALELERAKSIEDFRRFFVSYCQRQTIVRECLSNETNHFKVCQNETYVNGFNIYRGVLETLLDIECTGESIRLATFWRGLHILVSNQTELKKLAPCFARSLKLADELGNSNVDIASKIYIFHKEMQWFKECIHQLDLEQEFKKVVDVFLGEIVNRMKCINPQDGTLEPCSTMDAGLISKTSACSVKTRNDELDIYDALEDEVGRCLNFIFEYDQPPYPEEVTKEILNGICFRQENVFRCMDHSRIYSDMCMNETQQIEFRHFGDSIKNAFEASCSDEGRFVEVLFEVFHQKRTGHGNAVWDCVDVVKATRKQIGDHRSSSKNMRFYRELEAFKGCLVGKLASSQSSVDAATSLINATLGIVTCVHPEDGSTVLCKSIVHKSHVMPAGQV